MTKLPKLHFKHQILPFGAKIQTSLISELVNLANFVNLTNFVKFFKLVNFSQLEGWSHLYISISPLEAFEATTSFRPPRPFEAATSNPTSESLKDCRKHQKREDVEARAA